MTIGKIKRIALREVWKHEALDFTTWLVENIDVLSDVLGFVLQNPEKEQSAGDFSVDLVAEGPDGKPVVIENQLEKSDHDHLGKLITYVSALNASCAVWIVAQPRPEHVQGIAWLNESGLANFYLLKLEAIKIDESRSAPLLTLITGPTEEGRVIGDTKKQFVERYDLRNRFWQSLLDRAKSKTKLHANISPSNYSWVSTSSGKNGLSFLYAVTRHSNSVELVIDRGKDSDDENRTIFEQLKTHQAEIEAAFGGPLEWYTQEGVRLRRVRFIQQGGYRDDEALWPSIQDRMIDAMIRLEKAIRPFVQALQLN
jgi:hypothetical protein